MQNCTVVRRYDRFKYPPPGTNGGNPGGASKFVIKADTPEEILTPAAGKFELDSGDVFFLESAGGGGYGKPKSRAPERVAHDVAEGYVSLKAAEEQYGT